MIRAVSKGYFPPIPDTHNERSMVHVEDLAHALVLSAEKDEANRRVFIVTDGLTYSTRQMYEWVCRALGRNVPSWSIPLAVFRAAAKVGDGLGRLAGRSLGINSVMLERLFGSAHYDSTRLHQTLGYRPRWSLENALPAMVRSITAPADA
jgi:nucleoside-diphosphate-sugar epimerase